MVKRSTLSSTLETLTVLPDLGACTASATPVAAYHSQPIQEAQIIRQTLTSGPLPGPTGSPLGGR